jgi:hypothetical protein
LFLCRAAYASCCAVRQEFIIELEFQTFIGMNHLSQKSPLTV